MVSVQVVVNAFYSLSFASTYISEMPVTDKKARDSGVG